MNLESRVKRINSTPFARETIRLGAILSRLSDLVEEISIMGGGTGVEDILLEIAANCIAWVESRRPAQELLANQQIPWIEQELLGGKIVNHSPPDSKPLGGD